MITLPIQLRYCPAPQRAACARFVPGADAAVWVRELAGWGVPLTSLELFVVPRARDDLRPRGVLVRAAESAPLPADASGHHYGLVTDRLYAPVEAAVHPSVAEAEWRALLSTDYVACVWHPQTGLVGFEAGDRLRVAELLEPPPPVDGGWDRADPGVIANSRLISVEAASVPGVEEILRAGRGDIGEKGNDRSGLPRGPGETIGRALGGIAAGVAAPFAFAAGWLAQHLPRGSSGSAAGGAAGGAAGPSWRNSVEQWAANVLRNAADLWNARKRELERLMNLLESNPDEGLQYALPMGGSEAFRGLAPPGTRLGARQVDFSLGGLFGGGGAADVWGVPPDWQARLLERYRQLAQREMRLGRHRRAAYIYAHLLGDLNAAAATLASGGHYREAAVLYRDKLRRPLDAARCLEQGGLLQEAIPLYEELGDFVHAGDLYARLEQPDDARAAYRRAVEVRMGLRDHLGAAALLEQKLEVPDEALAALDAGWPESSQARQCLMESFHLLARRGRHDEAGRRVAKLRQDEVERSKVPALVEGLTEAANSYPDGRLRASAADAARVVTSRALVDEHDDARVLLRCIERLAPEDRLLARDCRRYRRPQPARGKPAAVRTAGARRGAFLVARVHVLPGRTDWAVAQSTRTGFYAAGYRARELLLVRGGWQAPDGARSEVSWQSRLLSGAPLLMSVDEAASPAVRLLIPGGPPLPPRSLPQSEQFPEWVSAETPGWLSDDVVGIDSVGGMTWCVEAPQFVLKGFNREGQPIALRGLPLAEELDEDLGGNSRPGELVPVHARDDSVYVGLGRRLLRISRGERIETYDFSSPIRAIIGSATFARARLAVLCEQGGAVFWPSYRGGEFARLPDDLDAPRGTFLRDGRLVICGRTQWAVFTTQQGSLVLEWETAPQVPDPAAVLAAGGVDEFAVCSGRGEMVVYRLLK